MNFHLEYHSEALRGNLIDPKTGEASPRRGKWSKGGMNYWYQGISHLMEAYKSQKESIFFHFIMSSKKFTVRLGGPDYRGMEILSQGVDESDGSLHRNVLSNPIASSTAANSGVTALRRYRGCKCIESHGELLSPESLLGLNFSAFPSSGDCADTISAFQRTRQRWTEMNRAKYSLWSWRRDFQLKGQFSGVCYHFFQLSNCSLLKLNNFLSQ